MNRGRLKLFVIFAVFLGPLLAAFLWYYGFGGGGVLAPRGSTNHAPLISPVIALQAFSNPGPDPDFDDGAPFTNESLKRRWSVIHPLTGRCGGECEKSLYNTRQTRLALGKDANRVQRILLSPNRTLLTRLADHHPDAIRLLESADGLENQLAPILKQRNIGTNDALLVDPLGNLMMIIPANLDPGLLLKDLKHLLKVSRIG